MEVLNAIDCLIDFYDQEIRCILEDEIKNDVKEKRILECEGAISGLNKLKHELEMDKLLSSYALEKRKR